MDSEPCLSLTVSLLLKVAYDDDDDDEDDDGGGDDYWFRKYPPVASWGEMLAC